MNKMDKLNKIVITKDKDITTALKQLNESATKVLLVIDNLENKKLLGTLTDGDVRRYILKTGKIEGYIKDIYNKTPIYILEDDLKNIEKVKNILLENKIEILPILNKEGQVVDYVEWSDLIKGEIPSYYEKIQGNIPIVIMAGGKGTRMQPFTKVLPKPLIPIKDRTAIELIIDQFKRFGLNKFYLTLNYKGEIIEAYFNAIEKDYEIDFIWEKDFLGTAGSLKFLENKGIESDFIVSNCDILLKANFKEILDFHLRNKATLTSITSIQHYKIPYGVVEIDIGGKIIEIKEKPEYTFQINTGVYILNKKTLEYIPKNKYFDMPVLIETLIKNRERVFAYPIKESDYIDLGQWEEYQKAIKIFEEGFDV